MRAEADGSRAGPFAHIHDLFAGFGMISIRKMFGGAGIYADGLMFALIDDGVIYLKAAPGQTGAFEREGCKPFTYASKDGRNNSIMSYWRMPERLYDDADELAHWARTAFAVAQRQSASKAKPMRKKPARHK
jgi:DNA transformation protein